MFLSKRKHTMKARVTVGGWAGFTLVELVVVISIISALTGLLLPAVQRIKRTSFKYSLSRDAEVKAFGQRVGQYANEAGSSLQARSWRVVASAANGQEGDQLDQALLRALYDDLLAREPQGNDLQTQADALLARTDITPEDRELLLDTKSSLSEALDGIQKMEAVLVSRVTTAMEKLTRAAKPGS